MKIFYGWRIVIAGGAIQFLQGLLLTQAFGAYFAVLTEELGWSKTALSGAAALQPMEAAVLGPVLGWMVDRFGSRGMIRIGTIIFGIGFILLSQIDSLPGFYAAFLVISLGSSLGGYFPISVTIIQWFEKRRARALSALQFGSSLGGVFVVAIAWFMESFGWRVTALASGIVVIVLGLPLAQVIRSRPADLDLTIDGLPPASSDTETADAQPQREFSASEALRTSAFWLISLGHCFSLFVVTAVNVHAITHIKEGLGYSIAQASLIISLVTAGQFGGVLLGWVIGERMEKRLVAAGCMIAHAAGLLMLTYAGGPVVLATSALVHGIAWGLRGPFMAAIRADYFGRRAFGMISGISYLVIVFGQIGGPLVAGAFADLTGDYRAGFTLLAVMAGLGSIFFLLAKPPR